MTLEPTLMRTSVHELQGHGVAWQPIFHTHAPTNEPRWLSRDVCSWPTDWYAKRKHDFRKKCSAIFSYNWHIVTNVRRWGGLGVTYQTANIIIFCTFLPSPEIHKKNYACSPGYFTITVPLYTHWQYVRETLKNAATTLSWWKLQQYRSC